MEEAELVADRTRLRHLLRDHPDWPRQEYADQIGRSALLDQEMEQAASGGASHRRSRLVESLLRPQASPTQDERSGR